MSLPGGGRLCPRLQVNSLNDKYSAELADDTDSSRRDTPQIHLVCSTWMRTDAHYVLADPQASICL